MQPLAITGLGIAGALGIGKKVWFEALAQENTEQFFGGSHVLARDRFPNAHAAEVRDFDASQYLGPKGLRNFDRLTKLLIVAAKLALEDAGLKRNGEFVGLRGDQVGICSSTAYGSLESITELKIVSELEDPRYLNPARFPNTVINSAAGYVSIWEDLRAPNVTIVDGNCGALDAALTCSTHLDHGRANAFLMGGGEALSEALYLAFQKLGIVAEGTMTYNPGHQNSQGMRVGEGAAFLCLEPPALAAQRGKSYSAIITGYGTAFEAPESEAVLVHASSEAVRRAVVAALRDAGLDGTAIDLVVSSASGVEAFDQAELLGIKQALYDDVPVAAPKTRYGETFGAAGALACVCAVGWLSGLPCRLLINGRLAKTPRRILVLAVGYYGNVSAVVLTHPNS